MVTGLTWNRAIVLAVSVVLVGIAAATAVFIIGTRSTNANPIATGRQSAGSSPATTTSTTDDPGNLQDRAIQSDLINALTSAKAAYANSGSYGTTPALEDSSLQAAEPKLSFLLATAEPAEGTNRLSVDTSADGQQLLLIGYSSSGGCWAVEDNEGTSRANVLVDTVAYTVFGVYYTGWKETTTNVCDDTGMQAAAPTWFNTGFPAVAQLR
jgi:hypothetical protein